jgi:hypothetical protein
MPGFGKKIPVYTGSGSAEASVRKPPKRSTQKRINSLKDYPDDVYLQMKINEEINSYNCTRVLFGLFVLLLISFIFVLIKVLYQ